VPVIKIGMNRGQVLTWVHKESKSTQLVARLLSSYDIYSKIMMISRIVYSVGIFILSTRIEYSFTIVLQGIKEMYSEKSGINWI
jgi:hypothetical protein